MRRSIELGRLAELTAAIAIEAGSIPAVAIPDLVDHILVATARTLGVAVATRDAGIRAYVESRRLGRVSFHRSDTQIQQHKRRRSQCAALTFG